MIEPPIILKKIKSLPEGITECEGKLLSGGIRKIKIRIMTQAEMIDLAEKLADEYSHMASNNWQAYRSGVIKAIEKNELATEKLLDGLVAMLSVYPAGGRGDADDRGAAVDLAIEAYESATGKKWKYPGRPLIKGFEKTKSLDGGN